MKLILGLNILEFTIMAWMGSILLSLICSFGPEVYKEQKAAWRTRHPRKEKKEDPERTITMPSGSWDPDTTLALPRVYKLELPQAVVVCNRPTRIRHGRHART